MPESLAGNRPRFDARPLKLLLGGRSALVFGVMVLLVACFSVIEHDPIFADAQIKSLDESDIRDAFIEQVEKGSVYRQVGLVTYALFGVAALAWKRGRPWNPDWGVATPLLLLLLWTYASVAWSGEPALTLKRLVVLSCVLIGSAGVARLLRPNEYLTTALVTLLAFVCGSLAIEVAVGGRPWEGGDYRFGGTLHPNAQATYCGLLCLAAMLQPIGFGRRWVLRALLVFGGGLLLLTQSRTGLLALLVSAVMAWTLRLSSLFRWAGMAAVLAGAATAVIAWNSVGEGVRSRVVDRLLLGRTEQAKSLTGRVPLWEELIGDIADRPILGYGYDGFWTTDRIAAITKSQNWSLQNAHNSYLEVVLQTGVVGLVLCVWLLLAALAKTIRAHDLTGQPGYAFAFAALVFGMTNSSLESLFVKLRYTPVLCLLGLLAVALFFPPKSEWLEEHSEASLPAPPFDHAPKGLPATPANPR